MSRQRRNFLKLRAAALGTAAVSGIPAAAQGNSGDVKSGRFAGKVVAITGATSGIGAAYTSSKRALEALAQSASQDYAERGLRVNVVAPDITDTPMFRRATGRDEEAVERASNIVRGVKRIAEPEEIARVALWLASDEASYMTGTTVLADGGLLTGFA